MTKLYHLPSDDYHPDFLKALAVSSHLDILEPEELLFWFESGKTQYEIGLILITRIKDNFLK